MTRHRITRRGALKASLMTAALAGTATFFGPWRQNRVWAQGKKPIKLGLTCDASGQYGNSGQDDMRGMRMAIDEFNAKGGVLGRKIEWITADTETNPATGTRVAERFIAQEQCGFLLGAIHSGVANAITQVANKYGTIYMNTNSSAPSEAGENCSRVKFVWDGNGTNFSKAAIANAVQKIGKKWLLLTNDYVWGHTTSAATKARSRRQAARSSTISWCRRTPAISPPICSRSSRSSPTSSPWRSAVTTSRHCASRLRELKLEDKAAWINNQQDWPDIWGVPETLFGVFGTTWYHMLKLPGVAEFVKRWQTTYPQSPIPVPGNVSYNGYMATRELLRAIESTGSTNNIALIKALEGHKMSAVDRMQNYDAWIDPVTHQVQQTIYLAKRNPKPADKYRHVRDFELDDARGGDRHRLAHHLQAEAVCRRADLRTEQAR